MPRCVCACACTSHERSAGYRSRPGLPITSTEQPKPSKSQASVTSVTPKPQVSTDAAQQKSKPGPKRKQSKALQQKPWYDSSPELEQLIPALFQSGKHEEARALLNQKANSAAAVTQFYLGVATGALEGEASACEHYERALEEQPMLHAARINLIRGLMRREGPNDQQRCLEHAERAVELQPHEPEPLYTLGVARMQVGLNEAAACAYESCLKLRPDHKGALVNGLHALGQLPPGQASVQKRILKIGRLGVSVGLWINAMQRPPHLIKHLTSKPWHEPRDFPMVALLEKHFEQIKNELQAPRFPVTSA